jgi:hypothetical protein
LPRARPPTPDSAAVRPPKFPDVQDVLGGLYRETLVDNRRADIGRAPEGEPVTTFLHRKEEHVRQLAKMILTFESISRHVAVRNPIIKPRNAGADK